MPEFKDRGVDSFRLQIKSYADQIESTIRRLEQQEMTPEATLRLDELSQEYSKAVVAHKDGVNDESYVAQLEEILKALDSIYK